MSFNRELTLFLNDVCAIFGEELSSLCLYKPSPYDEPYTKSFNPCLVFAFYSTTNWLEIISSKKIDLVSVISKKHPDLEISCIFLCGLYVCEFQEKIRGEAVNPHLQDEILRTQKALFRRINRLK